MGTALILSALLMGLAGTPHCLAMCGAACRAVAGPADGPASFAFHAGRLASYAAAGAVAASSVGVVYQLGAWSPALRPLWTLVHLAALGLGLWLVIRGRQPLWMDRIGRSRDRVAATGNGWQVLKGPVRSAGFGLAWVAWPCGLLQSALVVAALGNNAWVGAGVMGAFAVASSLGLVLGPALLLRVVGEGGGARADLSAWVTRGAGLMLAAASTWALGHDLIVRFVAWCVS